MLTGGKCACVGAVTKACHAAHFKHSTEDNSSSNTNMDSVEQHRYIIVFYHAGRVMDKLYGEWTESLEDCKKEAESLELDYCCGYDIDYESRVVPQD